jgi:hypothetical protein
MLFLFADKTQSLRVVHLCVSRWQWRLDSLCVSSIENHTGGDANGKQRDYDDWKALPRGEMRA